MSEDISLLCFFPGCEDEAWCSGLCQNHYKFWYRYRNSEDDARRKKAEVIDTYRVPAQGGRGHKYAASLHYDKDTLSERAIAWNEYQAALRAKRLEQMVSNDKPTGKMGRPRKRMGANLTAIKQQQTPATDRKEYNARKRWERIVGSPECSVDGCDSVGVMNGLCHVHAFQAQQQGGK